mmetsp:Transcript_25134/g.36952  ORF Transcript_25134/g.36952 Transcript_25134/m.36952 type:complete len:179 (+) Transcript_25134:1529-2065(+)
MRHPVTEPLHYFDFVAYLDVAGLCAAFHRLDGQRPAGFDIDGFNDGAEAPATKAGSRELVFAEGSGEDILRRRGESRRGRLGPLDRDNVNRCTGWHVPRLEYHGGGIVVRRNALAYSHLVCGRHSDATQSLTGSVPPDSLWVGSKATGAVSLTMVVDVLGMTLDILGSVLWLTIRLMM